MLVKFATMSKVTKIHQSKQPVRRHFLGEWLEARELTPPALLELLNDPDRANEYGEVDKSQVYRWLKGQLPQPHMQIRLAAVLGFEGDPGKLLRPPEVDWMNDFFQDKSREERARIKMMLEAAFPTQKSGTHD